MDRFERQREKNWGDAGGDAGRDSEREAGGDAGRSANAMPAVEGTAAARGKHWIAAQEIGTPDRQKIALPRQSSILQMTYLSFSKCDVLLYLWIFCLVV